MPKKREAVEAESKEAQAFLELAKKVVEAPKEPTVLVNKGNPLPGQKPRKRPESGT